MKLKAFMLKHWSMVFVSGLVINCCVLNAVNATPIAYSVASDSNDDRLFRIDLATGVANAIGSGIGFDAVEGLAFQPGTSVLFGADDASDSLITIDLATGVGSLVGAFGIDADDPGLAFADDGRLFLSQEGVGNSTFGNLYAISPATGASTLIGSLGNGNGDITGLAFLNGTLFGLDDFNDVLYSIDTATGLATLVGPLGFDVASEVGLAADRASNLLYGVDDEGLAFSINPNSGIGTVLPVTLANFEGLAIGPAPAPLPTPDSLTLMGLSLVVLYSLKKRKAKVS